MSYACTANLRGLAFGEPKMKRSDITHGLNRMFILIHKDLHIMAQARFYATDKRTSCRLFIHRHGYEGYGEGESNAIGMNRRLEAFKQALKSAGITTTGNLGSIQQGMESIGREMTDQRFKCFELFP